MLDIWHMFLGNWIGGPCTLSYTTLNLAALSRIWLKRIFNVTSQNWYSWLGFKFSVCVGHQQWRYRLTETLEADHTRVISLTPSRSVHCYVPKPPTWRYMHADSVTVQFWDFDGLSVTWGDLISVRFWGNYHQNQQWKSFLMWSLFADALNGGWGCGICRLPLVSLLSSPHFFCFHLLLFLSYNFFLKMACSPFSQKILQWLLLSS